MVYESRYSRLDRLTHRVAFRSYPAQVVIADLEDRLYAKDAVAKVPQRPVFVTALPRAGTTLLLECLAELKDFACHRYRDMPFVLLPIMWSKLTGRHHRVDAAQDRAHGDGMKVDLDSPEALEEVLWKTFWKQHYLSDRLKPWPDQPDSEFTQFFRHHMGKIIRVRAGVEANGVRYLSKNNPNIARLAMLQRMFPDATFVVPFRDPVQHAASLVRQHNHFVELQTADPFALEYMSAIGHYDFGKDTRPIDYNGWIDRKQSRGPGELTFWIEYWCEAYRHVLARVDNQCVLVSYDTLCADTATKIGRLADCLDIGDRDRLMARVQTIHTSAAREPDTRAVPDDLLVCARRLHSELTRRAI